MSIREVTLEVSIRITEAGLILSRTRICGNRGCNIPLHLCILLKQYNVVCTRRNNKSRPVYFDNSAKEQMPNFATLLVNLVTSKSLLLENVRQLKFLQKHYQNLPFSYRTQKLLICRIIKRPQRTIVYWKAIRPKLESNFFLVNEKKKSVFPCYAAWYPSCFLSLGNNSFRICMPTCVQNCKRTPGKKLKKTIPKFNGGGGNLQKYIHIYILFFGGGTYCKLTLLIFVHTYSRLPLTSTVVYLFW